MSIQLKILLLILLSTITLFILLAYFAPNQGQIKLRPKDIKYREKNINKVTSTILNKTIIQTKTI